MIVEPSRLQGAVLKGAFSHAGVPSIQVVASAQAAGDAVKAEAPDLLITSMQLPDGRGIELLQNLCQQSLLTQSTVVLNSNDSTIDELIGVGQAACLILAPKKARSEEIFRVVHGAGPCIVQGGNLANPVDAATLRLRIESESGRIPDSLADMIRQMGLIEVDIATGSTSPVATEPVPHLTMILRKGKSESADLAAIALRIPQPDAMTAVVEIDGENLLLRVVCRNGVVAICQRPLDARRINCLLQGCRLA
jgi:DNA-binding NarL/FixJ family response regulator